MEASQGGSSHALAVCVRKLEIVVRHVIFGRAVAEYVCLGKVARRPVVQEELRRYSVSVHIANGQKFGFVRQVELVFVAVTDCDGVDDAHRAGVDKRDSCLPTLKRFASVSRTWVRVLEEVADRVVLGREHPNRERTPL